MGVNIAAAAGAMAVGSGAGKAVVLQAMDASMMNVSAGKKLLFMLIPFFCALLQNSM
jgi:hypothetical protein